MVEVFELAEELGFSGEGFNGDDTKVVDEKEWEVGLEGKEEG